MKVLGNIIWLIFGGLEMAIGYALAGIVMFIFIITIPFGVQAMKLASFSLWPFGRTVIKRPTAGAGSAIGNVVWAIFAGIWIALAHLFWALVLAITIIGIPFAVAHLKLAGLALAPMGRDVVPLWSVLSTQHVVVVDRKPALPAPDQPAQGQEPPG